MTWSQKQRQTHERTYSVQRYLCPCRPQRHHIDHDSRSLEISFNIYIPLTNLATDTIYPLTYIILWSLADLVQTMHLCFVMQVRNARAQFVPRGVNDFVHLGYSEYWSTILLRGPSSCTTLG